MIATRRSTKHKPQYSGDDTKVNARSSHDTTVGANITDKGLSQVDLVCLLASLQVQGLLKVMTVLELYPFPGVE